MATVNAINRPRGQTRDGVAAILKYTMQEHKTEYEGRHLVSGINCLPECCYTEFISTKLQYGKCDGKMYYHFVQSFSPDEDITPDKAHEIAMRFAAERWHGYECIVATHTDAPHIHSHIIVNSVSFENGMKYHCGKETLTQLRNASDDLCLEYGLSICQPKPDTAKGYSQAEYHTALRGESWKTKLVLDIDNAMKYAVSKEQFIEFMESDGYEIKWTDTRKNITYTTPEGKKCRDNNLHEKKYLKGNMEYEFGIRKGIIAAGAESEADYDASEKSRESWRSTTFDVADGNELAGVDASGRTDRYVRDSASGNSQRSDYTGEDGRETGGAADGASGGTDGGDNRNEGHVLRNEESHREQLAGSRVSGKGFSEPDSDTDRRFNEDDFTTGWEPEREILFGYLRSGGTDETEYEAESVAVSNTVSGGNHLGIDTLLCAEGLMTVFGSDFDRLTPEEKRRRIEEKRAEDNSRAFREICDMLIRQLNGKSDEDENDSDYDEDYDEDDYNYGNNRPLSM